MSAPAATAFEAWAASLPVLSPSRLFEYIKCPACYYIARIEGRQAPRRSIAMPIGAGLHGGAAEARRQKMFGLWSVDSALAAAEVEFQASLSGASEPGYDDGAPPLEWDLGKYSDMQAPLDDVIRLTRKVVQEVVAAEDNILAVEEEIDFTGVVPFPMRGTADVRMANGEGQEIRDLKSAARAGVPDQFAAMQVVCYGLPLWATGTDVIVGIDQVAKTKAADIARYELVPTGDEFAAVCSLITDVARRIAAGDFPPRPGFFACAYNHSLPAFSLPVEWPAP